MWNLVLKPLQKHRPSGYAADSGHSDSGGNETASKRDRRSDRRSVGKRTFRFHLCARICKSAQQLRANSMFDVVRSLRQSNRKRSTFSMAVPHKRLHRLMGYMLIQFGPVSKKKRQQQQLEASGCPEKVSTWGTQNELRPTMLAAAAAAAGLHAFHLLNGDSTWFSTVAAPTSAHANKAKESAAGITPELVQRQDASSLASPGANDKLTHILLLVQSNVIHSQASGCSREFSPAR
ncbi:hypothetical protein AXG93_625s1110 [Marchantia polymorpha subsp. ruderalis]|uniref:Uncharacterized protein n=1 Tax=Marchantia polymorpha subsp. ruderalis TaxID=1480154 RepID=A0A176VDQ9_MARPO|nr:hypothetical protein AXG93_625s1110 [Marchantia polymorpha subsp. ruderalis]